MTVQKIQISKTFALPLESVTDTFAILAQRRKGKTYTGSVMAEEFGRWQQPFVVLDPTGAWWGLSSSADGKNEGLPVVIIGGPHAHIPLEPGAGKIIADLVVDHPGYYVIDFSRMLHRQDEIRFSTEFGQHLYRRKQRDPSPLHLFIDEADLFVPQKLPKNGKDMFDAYDGIVRRGGIYGLGTTMISQRAALINKDVLSQISVLIALQTVGPADQAAVFDYVKTNGTDDQLAAMRKSLASLPIGESWIFCPDRDILERVKIRTRNTFNSSATPKPGAVAIVPKKFSPIDLDSLGEKIQATVERGRQEDPRYWQAKVTVLESQLHQTKELLSAVKVSDPVEVHIPMFTDGDLKRIEAGLDKGSAKVDQLQDIWQKDVKRMEEYLTQISSAFGISHEMIHQSHGTINEIMPDSIRSERTDRAHGWEPISGPNTDPKRDIVIREAGDQVVGNLSPKTMGRIQSGIERYGGVQSTDTGAVIDKPQQKILNALAWFLSIGNPSPLKNAVAMLAGYKPDGGGFTGPIGLLRKAGYVEYGTSDRGSTVHLTDTGSALAQHPQGALTKEDLQHQVLSVLDAPEQKILRILLRNYPAAMQKEDLAAEAGYALKGGGFTGPMGNLRKLAVIEYNGKSMARACDFLFLK